MADWPRRKKKERIANVQAYWGLDAHDFCLHLHQGTPDLELASQWTPRGSGFLFLIFAG